MWRFSRGLAYAAKKQVKNAEREKAAFLEVVSRLREDRIMVINPAHHVRGIAEHMLNGEIAFAGGDIDLSVSELRKAIPLEDDLLYTEPPEWIQPMRHTLGAVLLSAGRYEEAEKVYRENLNKWPGNGWGLFGLGKCLRARGA